MEKEFSLFRKSAFGGFNRKDVISYIEKIRNESFEYRTQVENTVKDLNEKILELENAARLIELKDENVPAVSDIKRPYVDEGCTGDISRATKHLKTVADELCRSLGDFIEKLSRKGLVDESLASAEADADIITDVICDEEGDFVGGMLSSFGFICDEAFASEEKAISEEASAEDDVVSDILSGLSFLN